MGGGGNPPDFWAGVVLAIVCHRRVLICVAIIGIAAGVYWMWA
ncbi:hypothetical protein [Mesorhizobium sp. B1-1-7]|nr:hypothetical protein [Mesorhizobium sp. B1-1-7]